MYVWKMNASLRYKMLKCTNVIHTSTHLLLLGDDSKFMGNEMKIWCATILYCSILLLKRVKNQNMRLEVRCELFRFTRKMLVLAILSRVYSVYSAVVIDNAVEIALYRICVRRKGPMYFLHPWHCLVCCILTPRIYGYQFLKLWLHELPIL